ncbi:hypothetical protein V6Z11_A02G068500 [Gossypium hirsutum]
MHSVITKSYNLVMNKTHTDYKILEPTLDLCRGWLGVANKGCRTLRELAAGRQRAIAKSCCYWLVAHWERQIAMATGCVRQDTMTTGNCRLHVIDVDDCRCRR